MAATARAYSRVQSERTEQCSASRSDSRKLWLCAYFPHLALESQGLDQTRPVAILENVNGKPYLQALSEPARLAGIESGMTTTAAQALCPELMIRQRDSLAEHQTLQRLAQIAQGFSPWVSLDNPQCLLLEIGSCLSLFGGAERLRERLRQSLLTQDHHPQIAISPAPASSVLLARLNLEHIVTERQALRSMLSPLPITSLQLDEKTRRRLLQTGIRRLIDLWRLPRDGLTRRYGPALLRSLDALAGEDRQVLNVFQTPPRFYARRDMPVELERLEHFFPAIEQLAEEFATFLLVRDATALGISLEILHHGLPSTRLKLDFRNGSRDAGHWLSLLHEKLERSPLPAPAIAVALLCEAIVAFQPQAVSLFDDAQANGEREWQTLLDQLQTRLGHAALKRLYLQDDHRPEQAMGNRPTKAEPNPNLPIRPLWLFAKPEPLPLRGLRLRPETERIESGWWDGPSIRRDYRIAMDNRGRKLWIFQDLNNGGGWYLHGLFG